MPRPRVYQPELPPDLIKALYHEAQVRGLPMTKVLAQIVSQALDDTEGMRRAREELQQPQGQAKAA